MNILGVAIIIIGMVWSATYLIINEHPWWAALILLMVSSVRYRSK